MLTSVALCTLPSLQASASPPPRYCNTWLTPPTFLFHYDLHIDFLVCVRGHLSSQTAGYTLGSHAFLPLLCPGELDWCLWSCRSHSKLLERALQSPALHQRLPWPPSWLSD